MEDAVNAFVMGILVQIIELYKEFFFSLKSLIKHILHEIFCGVLELFGKHSLQIEFLSCSSQWEFCH